MQVQIILFHNFSNLAKSRLNLFLPYLPWNCTSTNSVPASISLLRMIPSPNLSWRTRSPGLYCWALGLTGSAFGVGVGLLSLRCADGSDGGSVGDEGVVGDQRGRLLFDGLPLP